MITHGQQSQLQYYTRTAGDYERLHSGEDSDHEVALEALCGLLPAIDAGSLLDVGTGTGRVLRYFGARLPTLQLAGLEAVPAMVHEAERQGVPPGVIALGDGAKIPFGDGSFDVVTSFGVLHHVAKPGRVIREMMRVARKAVFISDGNRFAQGRPWARYVKLALHGAGLWPLFDFVRTRGRGFMESEGDGVYYSYSIFDSLPELRSLSARLLFLELSRAAVPSGRWSTSVTNAPAILVGAYK